MTNNEKGEVWKEFGNSVAESTLRFTDSLQLVNISGSGG